MKKWLGFFVFVLLVVSSVGLVSGAVNLAPSGTPEYNYYGSHLDTYGVASYINDNDATVNFVGVGGDAGWSRYIIGYNAIVNFAYPVNIERIEYARSYPRMTVSAGCIETISVYSGGVWTTVNTYSLSGVSNVPVIKQIDGNWQNVEKVRLNVQFIGESIDRNYHRLYELRSFGSYCGNGICDVGESCASCVTDCGCGAPNTCLEGISAYWKLDEENGTVAEDFIGVQDGKLIGYAGDTYKGVPGQVDGALRFDGIEDYVNITDFSWAASDSFSIGFWMNPFSIEGSQGVMGKGEAGGYGASNWEWSFRLNDDALSFVYWNSGGGAGIDLSSVSSPVVLGKWDYFVMTYNSSVAVLYKNGEVVSVDNTIVGPFQNRVTPMLMGHAYVTGGGNYYYRGMLDDVVIYDRALTASEVEGQYQKGVSGVDCCTVMKKCSSEDQIIMKLASPKNSLGALWDDEDYSWDICYDEIFGVAGAGGRGCSGNKVVGLSAVSDALAQEPSLDSYPIDVCYGDLSCTARSGDCEAGEEVVVALDKDNGALLTDINSDYNPEGIVSWWKLEGNAVDSVSANNGTIYGATTVSGKVGDALSFDGVNDYVDIGDKANLEGMSQLTISAWIYPKSATTGTIIAKNGPYALRISAAQILGAVYTGTWESVYGNTAMNLNSWNHVLLTYDGSNIRVYLNGKLDGSVAKTGVLSVTSASVQIGNSTEAGFNQGFNGIIDEVKIWNRALTASEIQNLYSMKNICCTGAGASPTSGREWRDMNGDVISSANVGDTVQMVLTNSLSGTFEIWEYDLLTSDDPIRVGANAITGVVDDGDLVGVWTITQEDKDLADDILPENYENFQFEVGGIRSRDLAIVDGGDDPMNITIISPMCGQVFDEGDVVSVGVDAADSDDLITGKVTIGNTVVPFSNGGVVFDYTFNVPGNHQVIVDATNSRGERSRNIASVMVLDKEAGVYVNGVYVAACIDKPKDFSDIPGSVVDFDASGTRGIRVVGGVPIDVLPGNESLNFYWSFFPDLRTYGSQYIGTGNSLAYSFITEFAVAGDNSATLRVELI